MAHFCLLVVTSTLDDIADALRPFFDDDDPLRRQQHFAFIADRHADPDPETGRRGYWKNPIGKWDGWVTGGRWEGLLGGANVCRVRDLAAHPDWLDDVFAVLIRGVWFDRDEAAAAGLRWSVEL